MNDNDGILRKKFGKLFQSIHPLNKKNVLNKSDLAGGTMALWLTNKNIEN